VRRGDRDPAVEPELADREIEHLRADQAELEDVRSAGDRAANRRLGHAGRGDPHVVPDGDPPRLKDLDERAADRLCPRLVDVGRVDPADVVGLEHLGIEHGRMLRNSERGTRRCLSRET
jgi:hypothetical protein